MPKSASQVVLGVQRTLYVAESLDPSKHTVINTCLPAFLVYVRQNRSPDTSVPVFKLF